MPWQSKAKKQWHRPQIALSAVKEFLGRPLADWSQLKQLSSARHARALHNAGMEWHTRPRVNQLASLVAGIQNSGFMFSLDMGLGKTKIGLDLTRFHLRRNGARRALSCVLGPSHIDNFMEQVREHAPDLHCIPIIGNRREKLELLEEPADLNVINYGGLIALLTEHDKDAKELVPVQKMVRLFSSLWDVLLLDETHVMLSSHKSLTYKLCRPISRRAKYCYGFTGTPFDRNPALLWSQFYLVDHGAALGETLGLFRAAFFHASDNFWGGVDYTFRKDRQQELNRCLRHSSLRYDEAECTDVPKVTPIVRRVPFGAEIPVHYRLQVERLRAARGDRREIEDSFIRMRQLTAGYIGISATETEERMEVEFDSCPKLDALMELLQEIPAEEPVIIFHEFILSGKRIVRALQQEKITHAQLNGATKELEKWKSDPNCRVLACNWRTGGTGHNLQRARYGIFFESPVSYRNRVQAEKRFTGARQTRHSFVYDLVVSDSVDERVLQFVREGGDLFEAIMKGRTDL